MPMRVRKRLPGRWTAGTRFRPPRKAQPKEMLPIVDKPIIQYGVEEAPAGVTRSLSWTGRGKQSIEDHFDVSYELEKMLEERHKTDLLQIPPLDLRHDSYCLRATETSTRTCRPG